MHVRVPGAISSLGASTASASAPALPFVLSRTSAALAAQALEGTSVEKHPRTDSRGRRTVGRQRRPEHGRPVRRCGVLSRPAEPGDPERRPSRSPTASASTRRWSASSGSTRTACWRWCTAAATTIRACRTSRRWASGTPASRTAANRSAGWAGWPMRATTRRPAT